MLNNIKELYRYNIYKECRILVNDMNDVIEEVKLFLDSVVYPYLKNGNSPIIVDNISIRFEDDEIIWSIVLPDQIIDEGLYIDIYNVKETFNVNDEYVEIVKEKYSDFPKELFVKSWMMFMKSLSTIIFSETIINEELNVFDICKIGNNGHNNVVFN
jgi:hypothetical protein